MSITVGTIAFTTIVVDADGNTEVMELLRREYESVLQLMQDWAVIKQHWEQRVYGDGPRTHLKQMVVDFLQNQYCYAELYLLDEMTDTASVEHEYLRTIEKIDIDSLIGEMLKQRNIARMFPVFPLVPLPI